MHPKFLGFLPTVCHLVVFHPVSNLTYCLHKCVYCNGGIIVYSYHPIFFKCYVQVNHFNFNEWHIIVLLIVRKLHQYVSKHN
jgi:hypothetical protein